MEEGRTGRLVEEGSTGRLVEGGQDDQPWGGRAGGGGGWRSGLVVV